MDTIRRASASRTPGVVVVAGGETLISSVRAALAAAGTPCVTVPAQPSALEEACRRELLGVMLEVHDIGVLRRLSNVVSRIHPGTPIVVLANPSTEALAVEAVRTGAADYIAVPFDPCELAFRARRLFAPPLQHTSTAGPADVPVLAGSSDTMRRVHEFIANVGPTEVNVLITGETGTGKELVAALLHRASSRRQQRLVSINCPALPDTLFESELFGHERGAFTGAESASEGKLQAAHRGTVFLDEVADLSLTAQAKLLRTIEAHEISRLGRQAAIRLDLRFFSATNQDLARLADEGRFRRDLYYRLKVCHLHLPPLRDRPGDVPELVEHFLRSSSSNRSRGLACSGDAMAALVAYRWPGNIRELRNALEGLLPFVRGECIDIDDLPEYLRRPSHESADERGRILAALHGCRWNKRAAARELHWSRMTLYRKLAKYGIAQTSSGLRRVSRDMSPVAVTRARD